MTLLCGSHQAVMTDVSNTTIAPSHFSLYLSIFLLSTCIGICTQIT